MWQNTHVNTVRCATVCHVYFSFPKILGFYNFIIPPLQNCFLLKVAPDLQLRNFFICRKSNVLFSRYLDFLCFCEIHRFQNLWCHCCIMQVTLMHILSNPKHYQNEIWSNTCVLYDKHFQHDFGSMLGTGN